MQWKKYLSDSGMIVAILCSFVLGIYALKGIYPFGQELMLWGDMIDQGIPYLYRAYDILTGAESPVFSWSVSAGMPLGYSFSPFHLLLLLTERENIYCFVSVIVLVRMIAMALAMYVFTCRYSIHRHWKIACSVLYGMGSCALIYYQIDYVMMDHAILFPILMRGFYSLMEESKPFLYIAVLALAIAHSIYVSYMILLYLFSISIPYFYFMIRREEFQEKCRNLVLATLFTVGISSFSWVPAWFGLMDSSRMEYGTEGGWIATYLRAMGTISLWDVKHFILCSYFFLEGSFFLAAILSAWKCLNGKFRYHRYQLLLICLAVFLPGTELLWHGGSRTLWPVRFSFLLNFVLAEIFLVTVQERFLELSSGGETEKKKKLVISAVLGGIGLMVCFSKFPAAEVTPVWIILMILFYRYILTEQFPWKKQALAAVLALDLACGAFLWIAPDFTKSSDSQNAAPDFMEFMRSRDFWKLMADGKSELAPETNSPFFRIRDYYSYFGPNYAMILGTSSISNGIGTVPRSLIRYYDSLGYVDVVGTTEHMDQMTDTGGTAFTDALLGIRGVFTVNTLLDSELYRSDPAVSAVHFYRHRYTLPFGIELTGDALPDENIFCFQNNLFRSVTGGNDILIHERNGEGSHREIPVAGRQELYFYSDSKAEIHFVSVNGKEIFIPNGFHAENKKYPASLNCRVIDLGTFENETVVLDFEAENDYDFSQIHIGALDIRKMSEAFALLQEKNTASGWETGPDFVNLEYMSPDGGTLFLPVWNFKGWQCEVNGRACHLGSVLGGWIGVPLEQGSNEIRLRFRPETHWPSVALSFICLGAGMIFLFFLRKGLLLHQWAVLGHLIGKVYLISVIVFVLFLYILPIPLGLYYTIQKTFF